MKKIFKYAALVCASAAVAISCVEENLEPIIPAVDGDGIVFGVRAGFEDSAPQTRTEYSGEDYTVENSDGTTTKFERIDWVVNDKIEIYSPQAENPLATTDRPKSTHYVVTNLSADDGNAGSTGKGSDYAKLANVGEAGLRWNGTQTHDFYAMYPSSEMFRSETGTIPDNINKGVLMGLDKETSSKVMVYGVIPDVQQPTVVPDPNNSGSYIAKPDMNYAYMVAKTSVDPNTTNNVKLSFVPIVTAVEIELVNVANEAVTIREIQVASDEPIVGGFTADLSGWTDTYPDCTNLTASAAATEEEKEIQVTTLIQSGSTYTGVNLIPSATLKFTVFLLPGSDIENLTVRVSSLGYSYISKELKNANIPANLKTRIKHLNLPGDAKEFESSGDNWMDQLDPNSVIKSLSLPGTGGSFTSEVTNEAFRQQDLTFDEQWALGVRAFELSSDRPSSATTSLGGEKITCNKVDVVDASGNNITVIDAVRAILGKLATYKTETAALILTYQPEGSDIKRNVESYSRSLAKMLDGSGTTGQGTSLSSEEAAKIIPYTAGLTLGEVNGTNSARGKLILICRPNQNNEAEENGETFASAMGYLPSSKVTAINGCGTAKDRWGARGYKTTSINENWAQGTNDILGLGGLFGYQWGDKTLTGEGSVNNNLGRALDISNSPLIESVMTEENIANGRLGANDTRKGYDVTSSYVESFLSGKEFNIFQSGSTYTMAGKYGNVSISRPDPTDPTELQFGFETNQTNTVCWFQEWARVVPEQSVGRREGTWRDPNSNYSYGDYDIYWFESYSEKLSNVKTTFDMAIENYDNSYIYINSLCGYLATTETDVTPTWSLAPSMPGGTFGLWGGAGGDVKGLSDILNPAFYNYVAEKGLGIGNQVTGPTGIVLMDFVEKEGAANKTAELIAAIITNNQKYATSGPTLDNTNKEEGSNNPVQPF